MCVCASAGLMPAKYFSTDDKLVHGTAHRIQAPHMTQFKCLTTWVLLLLFVVLCVFIVCMICVCAMQCILRIDRRTKAFPILNEFIHCVISQFFFYK